MIPILSASYRARINYEDSPYTVQNKGSFTYSEIGDINSFDSDTVCKLYSKDYEDSCHTVQNKRSFMNTN